MAAHSGNRLRSRLANTAAPLRVPGVYDGLSALLAERTGFCFRRAVVGTFCVRSQRRLSRWTSLLWISAAVPNTKCGGRHRAAAVLRCGGFRSALVTSIERKGAGLGELPRFVATGERGVR